MKTYLSLLIIFWLIVVSQCINGCKEGEFNEAGTCIPCKDDQCDICMSNKSNSCLQCKAGFVFVNDKCGIECNSLKLCSICSIDLTECLFCSDKCSLKDGKCSCTSKIVIIVVCVLISVIIVGIILYCLTKPSSFLKKKPIDLNSLKLNNAVDPLNNQYLVSQRQHEIAQINVNHDILPPNRAEEEIQVEELFNMNKVDVGDVNDKQLCDQCKDQTSHFKLSCGCCFCYEHGKAFEIPSDPLKKCPMCFKEVEAVRLITCGICFQIKGELAKFPCQCSLFVCKECFVLTKKALKNCPACRANI